MANEVGALRAVMSASHAQFASDMGKARAAVQSNGARMKRAMESVKGSFASALGSLQRFGGYALAGGAAAFVVLIKKSIDTADQLGKLSQSLGISVEQLSTLRHAADLSGVGLEEFAKGLRTLSKNATDTANKTGEARYAFGALEIDVKDVNGVVKSADTLLLELADKFAGLDDDALKTSMAMKIFGDRVGPQMIPLLNSGAEGIRKEQERAKALGLELNDNTTKAAADFNDKLTNLKASVSGVGLRIVTELMPGLNQMIGAMAQAWENGDKLGTVLWKAFTAPNRVKEAREEFEKWDEKMRMLQSDDPLRRIKIFPYTKGEVEEAFNRAKASLLIAEYDAKRFEQEAAAAGDARRAQEEEAKLAEEERKKNSQALAEKMAGLKKEEEEQKAAAAAAKARAKEEQREAEERLKRGEDTIEQLTGEKDLFNAKTRAEKVAWEIEQGSLADLSAAHQEKILALAKELDVLDALKKAQDKLTEKEKAQQKTAKQMHLENQTATEKYTAAVQALDDVFVSTSMSVVDYERELARLKGMLETDLTRAIENWGDRAADVLTRFAMTGKLAFRDFANSVIADLLRMEIQQRLTGPLFQYLSGSIGGTGGIPSVLQRASGGPVAAGRFYEVNERGPELLSLGTRQFLMMAGQSGQVSPLHETGSSPAGKEAVPQSIRIVNVLDPAVVGNWAASSAGEQTILNIMARHATQLRQMVN